MANLGYIICENLSEVKDMNIIGETATGKPIAQGILQEVEELTQKGIKEFCIISQDTSKYGLDIYGELKLAELLEKMAKIEGVKWIRILYMYLFETTDELIEEMGRNKKVCSYFDIPIQHLNDEMLRSMNRHDNKKLIYDRIAKISD